MILSSRVVRVPLGIAVCLAQVMTAGVCVAQAPAPNIVFFLADDMGIGDTSAYQDLSNNPDQYQIDTPNIERLAQIGTRFTDAHAPAAVCTPTRLSLLTGIYSFRSPLKNKVAFEGADVIGSQLPGDRRTFAHLLRDAGYGTYGVGKWHIGAQVDYGVHEVYEGPLQSGFDRYTGTKSNFPGVNGIMRDNEFLTYDANFNLVPFGDPSAIPWDPVTDNPNNFGTGANRDITAAIQQTNFDAAQQYLADHNTQRPDDPFLLYYASHANHTPLIAGDDLDGVVIDGHTKAGAYLDVPTTTDGSGNIIPTGPDYGNVVLSRHWDDYLETDGQGNVTQHGPGERGKMIDENDVALGHLLDYLEQTDDPRNPGHKLIDNTLVVFTSDNGADLQSEPSVGALPQSSDGVITDIRGKKASPYEGGTRVPFIASWAGEIAEGATSDALFGLNDIYATFAEITGEALEATEAVDSESALGALRGTDTGDFRDSSLVYKYQHRLIIRNGDMKLIATDTDFVNGNSERFDGNLDFANLQAYQLYDLSIDGAEATNLLNNPAYASTVTAMLAELQNFVDQGFSRTGAQAIANGVNFQGGDINAVANYQGYGDGGTFALPVLTETNPNFIFVDGTATARVTNAWIIQGNGNVHTPSGLAGLEGGRWELRGGSVTSNVISFQIRGGGVFTLSGGEMDLAQNTLRMEFGDALLDMKSGDATFNFLTVGSFATTTPGNKVIKFSSGPGATLTFISGDPVRIFSDGSLGDDYITFDSGSLGRIITAASQSYFDQLWDDGHLRVDDMTGTQLGVSTFTDLFDFLDNGNGTSTLQLIQLSALAGDLDGDGFVGIADLNIVLGNWNQNAPPGDPLADPSGDGFVGIEDLNTVLGNWNAGTPPTGAVPEPTSLALLGFAGTALLRRKR